MAAGIGLGISMGWTYIKTALGVVDSLFAILKGRSTFFENEASSKTSVEKFETEGILDKASILLTPTGYSSGAIHNVKPDSTPFGDLAFTRTSSATRINEQGLVEVLAANIPRIDYSTGVGAVFLEESSTNQIRYSEDFSNALWQKAGVTLTSSTGINPKGESATIYAIQGTAAQGGLEAAMAAGASGNGVGVSIWARKKSGVGTTNVEIGYGDSSSGAGHTVSVGADWQRITYTSTGYTAANRFYIDAEGQSADNTIEIWGAQVEKSATGANGLVSSYIPTTSTSETRTVDEYVDGGHVSLINSPSGVLFVERQCFGSTANEWILLTATGEDETISVGIYGNNNSGNSARIKTSTSTLYKGFGGSKVNMDKLAVKWDGTSVKTFRNGALFQTGTLSGGFTANQLTELHLSTGQGFYGRLKQLAVFNEALTDAEIIALTT
jgi:hypothetical protein